MAYTPNFSDPRVQRRIKQAIGFAVGAISASKPRGWSTRYIDKWFGKQSNPLSAYLRQQLLIVTNERYNRDSGECKQYVLNTDGVRYLAQSIGLGNRPLSSVVVSTVQQEFSDELASGQFEYKDQSNRLWHPLQNFRRESKTQILEHSGYCHHYDIQSCAMTLIHQHSQRIPEIVCQDRWQQGPMDLYLFALRSYLANRKQFRDQMAAAAEIPVDMAKRIVNALLAGAQLSCNPDTQIYRMLSGDTATIRFLQQYQPLVDLRQDIKTCWDYIKPTLPQRTCVQKNGRERRLPLSSQQKWSVYFDLERQVLNEVRSYLDENNIKYFLEHDGWSCDREVDQVELQKRIQKSTGFRVEFEMK